MLEIAGLVPPPWAGSLFGTPGEEEIVLEVRRSELNVRIGGDFFDRDLVALVTSPFKLIRSSRGEVELYELSRDPEEIRDLRSQQPGVAETLEKRLSALEARTPPIHPSALNLELRDETVEALRAMGYLE